MLQDGIEHVVLDGFPSLDGGLDYGIDVKLMRREGKLVSAPTQILKMEAFSTSLALVEKKERACAKIDSIEQLMQITLLDTV